MPGGLSKHIQLSEIKSLIIATIKTAVKTIYKHNLLVPSSLILYFQLKVVCLKQKIVK